MDVYLGTVQSFAFSFAPRGWMLCAGQTLSISQNTALFSLIGTAFGGDGRSTFGIPNLQGRTILGQGVSSNVNYQMGASAGSYTTTLLTNNLAPHNHTVNPISGSAAVTIPAYEEGGSSPAPGPTFNLSATSDSIYSTSGSTTNLKPFSAPLTGLGVTVGIAGSSIPVNVTNPLLVTNYSICTQGLFPSRN